MVPFILPIFCFIPIILGVPITMAPLLGILFLWVVTCGAYFNTAILQEMRSFILRTTVRKNMFARYLYDKKIGIYSYPKKRNTK
jgi:hypothetical protein